MIGGGQSVNTGNGNVGNDGVATQDTAKFGEGFIGGAGAVNFGNEAFLQTAVIQSRHWFLAGYLVDEFPGGGFFNIGQLQKILEGEGGKGYGHF